MFLIAEPHVGYAIASSTHPIYLRLKRTNLQVLLLVVTQEILKRNQGP